MSQVEEQVCPNMECEHCQDENGMMYEIDHKHKHDTDQDEVTGQDGDDDVTNNDVTHVYKSHDKFAMDEFHLLHSRLHGKALEEAERTQDEQYAKVGSLASRKEWLEKRRANAKKIGDEPEKLRVRFGEVSQDPPQTASNQSVRENTVSGIKNYQYRQPHREYRSPNNGYEKSRHGYGCSGGSTWRDQPPVRTSSEADIPEYQPKNDRKNGYKYTSINYHLSDKVGDGDVDLDHDAVDSVPTRNRSTNLGYSQGGSTKWNSQIKANNVSRDTSRGNHYSSTWPQQTHHQEEEIYEFMIPDNLRRSKTSFSEKSLSKTKPEPYIYRRPSTLEPINDPNSPPKSPKKKDKYSHIQSRYSKGIYQPGKPKPKQRYVISAYKKGRKGQTNNTTQNGRNYTGNYV